MQFLTALILGGIVATILLYRRQLCLFLLYLAAAAITAGLYATLISAFLAPQSQEEKNAYVLIMFYFLVAILYACFAIQREGKKWQILDERARAYQKASAWGEQRTQAEVVAAIREELRKKRYSVTDANIHRALHTAGYPIAQGK